MKLSPELLDQLKDTCAQYRVRELALFGSALTEHYTDKSDLDFAVAFQTNDTTDAFTRYFEFKEALERITQRQVDLVNLDSVHNPHFQSELAASKQELYVA